MHFVCADFFMFLDIRTPAALSAAEWTCNLNNLQIVVANVAAVEVTAAAACTHASAHPTCVTLHATLVVHVKR